MRATSEGSFSSGTQAGEFSASVYLPKMPAALHSRRKIESNFRPECQAETNADQLPCSLVRTEMGTGSTAVQ